MNKKRIPPAVRNRKDFIKPTTDQHSEEKVLPEILGSDVSEESIDPALRTVLNELETVISEDINLEKRSFLFPFASSLMFLAFLAAGLLLAEVYRPFTFLAGENLPLAGRDAYNRGFIAGYELGAAAGRAESSGAGMEAVDETLSITAELIREIEILQDRAKTNLEMLSLRMSRDRNSAFESLSAESKKVLSGAGNEKRESESSLWGTRRVGNPFTGYVIPAKTSEDVLYTPVKRDRQEVY